MGWIGRHQHGRFYHVSCQTVVRSGLFAFMAVLIAVLVFPVVWSFFESLLLCTAMDAVIIMVWVLWKLMYKKGEPYI